MCSYVKQVSYGVKSNDHPKERKKERKKKDILEKDRGRRGSQRKKHFPFFPPSLFFFFFSPERKRFKIFIIHHENEIPSPSHYPFEMTSKPPVDQAEDCLHDEPHINSRTHWAMARTWFAGCCLWYRFPRQSRLVRLSRRPKPTQARCRRNNSFNWNGIYPSVFPRVCSK